MNKWVELGRCTKPHGVRGAFSFDLYNTEESVLSNLKTIKIVPLDKKSKIPADGQEINIKSISIGNKAIVYLEGIEDRNQVEAMLPFTIFADRALFPEADEDEVYLSDLEGLRVVEFETGIEVGKITSIETNGFQDLVVIRKVNGEFFELPFVPVFFKEVDIEKGEAQILLPDYLE